MLNLSGSQVVLALVFGVGWAVLGYYLAQNDKRNLGRTPWGVPSAGWALIWFLSSVVGVVLWIFAHRAEVRRAAQGPLAPLGGNPMAGEPPPRSVASDFPAYPRRADSGPSHVPPVPPVAPLPPAAPAPASSGAPDAHAAHAAPSAPAAPVAADHSPPAWHPDPSGRYHYRWWTGSEWTSYVATHGQVEVDVSPDQRIGPY